MSQWFHRNPLKSTAPAAFDFGTIACTIPARSLCSQAKAKRARLLPMFGDPNLSTDALLEATNQYLAILMGFVENPPDTIITASGSSASSKKPHKEKTKKPPKKSPVNSESEGETEDTDSSDDDDDERNLNDTSLRNFLVFRWTNTLFSHHAKTTVVKDAAFEVASILLNLALWFSKHAAKVASKSDITMEEAKEVHKSLRHAAGLFTEVSNNWMHKLTTPAEAGGDLDANILQAYCMQFTAEAQEVTMARAIEAKHSPSLVSALAFETAQLYEKAKLALAPLPIEVAAKWRTYCLFKFHCYNAYALCYHTDNLLSEDKGGDAILAAREALKHCEFAKKAAGLYDNAPGAGLTAKPTHHCFFRRLEPLARRMLSKAESENAMIYHQKVPSTMPELRLKATYGLVVPEMPSLSFDLDPAWSEAKGGFNLNNIADWVRQKRKNPNMKKLEKASKKVEPIKEQRIYDNDSDPNNSSGCTLS